MDGTAYAIIRTNQELLDQFWLDIVPMRYESQDIFLGTYTDPKVYEEMDFLFGDISGTATADFAFHSKLPNGTEETSSARTTVATETNLILHTRLRGNQCRYVVHSEAADDLPQIQSLRIHMQPLRPRARARP